MRRVCFGLNVSVYFTHVFHLLHQVLVVALSGHIEMSEGSRGVSARLVETSSVLRYGIKSAFTHSGENTRVGKNSSFIATVVADLGPADVTHIEGAVVEFETSFDAISMLGELL